MQASYAMLLSESDKLDVQEKHLLDSMENLHLLYVLQFELLLAIRDKAQNFHKVASKRYLPQGSIYEKSPNFYQNQVLLKLASSLSVQDFKLKKNTTHWQDHEEIIDLLWGAIKEEQFVADYLSIENPDFVQDKQFVIDLFRKIIAPHDALHEFYENEIITWLDDVPFVNTWVLNQLKSIKRKGGFNLEPLYKDAEDKDFAKKLLRKTILNYQKYEKEVVSRTPNWDPDRITKIDKVLMVMGIVEFLDFPSIPTKVTINEYIEIAKDYATQKSSYFINGVLDKLVTDFNQEKRIQKTGRGLM
jgi:N utilization substance protein B